jgi:hypothetical protein
MSFQTHRMRKLARAAFTAAGRNADDVLCALPGQGENPGYMGSLALYSKNAGFPIDFLSPAIYDVPSMDVYETALHGVSPWSDGTLYRQLDTDQLLDSLEAFIAWFDVARPVAQLRSYLDSIGLEAVPIWTYEGGLETLATGDLQTRFNAGPWPYAEPVMSNMGNDWAAQKRVQHHPRMRRILWGWLNEYQKAGLNVFTYFEYGGTGGGSGVFDQCWDQPIGVNMLPGTGDGSDGRFDNRTDLLAFDRTVSPMLRSLGDWNAGATDPPDPPDPNLTNTARNRRDVVWDTKMVTTAGARGSFSVLRAGGARAYQFTFPAGASDYAISAPFLASKLLGYAMAASKDATVKTNSTSTPDNTFLLKANSPDLWRYDWTAANPFVADVTTFHVTCPADTEFKLLILVDPT